MSKDKLFAVCIKFSEKLDQVLGKKSELVPGELVKIVLLNEENSNYVIKVYNHKTKKFGNSLYQCNQDNIKRISVDAWENVQIGTKVTLHLILPYGNMNVMFFVNSYGDCRALGAGRFFSMDLIDQPKLSDDDKFQIRLKYYNTNQSTYMIRADKLFDALVLDRLDTASIARTIKPSSAISTKTTRLSSSSAQSETKAPTEPSLIDWDTEIMPHDQPNIFTPFNMQKANSIGPTLEDAQLQNLKEGLEDLKELTATKGRNQFGFQQHEIEQSLYERNSKIQEYLSVRSSPLDYYNNSLYSNYSIGRQISSNITVESTTDQLLSTGIASNIRSSSSNNVPPTILRKIEKINLSGLSSQLDSDVPMKQFQLPVTNIAQEPVYLAKSVNPSKKSRSRKRHQKNYSGNPPDTINCWICHNTAENKIMLDCQHVFCGPCLITVIEEDSENVHCPLQNGKYKCSYKLMREDVQRILNTFNDEFTQSSSVEPDTVQRSTPNVSWDYSRKVIQPKNANYIMFEDDDDRTEVLFYCKQDNCRGCWFVDPSEGRNIYRCEHCKTFNCFKCQGIHDNVTCEDYKQETKVVNNPSNNFQYAKQFDSYEKGAATFCDDLEFPALRRMHEKTIIRNRRNDSHRPKAGVVFRDTSDGLEFPAWTCIYCNYSENHMDIVICLSCLKPNDHVRDKQQSWLLDNNRSKV